ncbi:MAG: DUF975 family protein [Bacteroidales bacterium]|nr:DUF975 family protein [Bacteroidales bacterium]
MRTNKEYKEAALNRLRGNWSPAVLATLFYLLIVLVFTGGSELPRLLNADTGLQLWLGGASLLLVLFLVDPMEVGYSNALRLLYERRDYEVSRNMLDLSLSNYLHKVLGMFFMGLKVVLWTFLFIIPGLVMSFAYAMTPYILEEHPEISAWEASARSREMMAGHKFDLFYLYLSFIGWILLAILTLGIGFLWLEPYMSSAVAAFYNDLKAAQGEEAVTE